MRDAGCGMRDAGAYLLLDGMAILSPAFSEGTPPRPLIARISATVTPWRSAIRYSVSPLLTRYLLTAGGADAAFRTVAFFALGAFAAATLWGIRISWPRATFDRGESAFADAIAVTETP